MRRSNGFAFFLLLVIALIGFSFYRGYLTLNSQQQPTTQNTEIKLLVDQQKAKSDIDRAGTELKKMSEKVDLNPAD